MKKIYETPTVEKIRYNYRDQVVAASAGGSDDSSSGYNNNLLSGCVPSDQIGDYIRNSEIFDICEIINNG